MTAGYGFTSKDLVKLRGGAILAFSLIASGGGMLFFEYKQSAAIRIALRQADGRFQEADRKLQRVSDEEAELKAKSALFRQLQARRIIGPEQRLVWVETVNGIRDRRKLFGIDYEITPQQTIGTPAGPYQFAGSSMQFRLPLLHERDLTDFLSDLRNEAPAVVHVERCRIERAGADRDGSGLAPLLAAQCAVRWITVYDTRGEPKK